MAIPVRLSQVDMTQIRKYSQAELYRFRARSNVRLLLICSLLVIIGSIDLLLPVKTSFLTIVFVLIMKPLDDFTIAWGIKKLNPQGAEDALLYLLIALGAAIATILVDLLFLVNPLSNINLTGEGITVRASVASGIVILLLFVRQQFTPVVSIGRRKLQNWAERRRRI